VKPLEPGLSAKHAAVCRAGGFLRSDARGIIEVRGVDRATWLHNLVTNVIATLRTGEGNYAFAVNVQGRTVFDLNALIFDDRIWLDVDRRWVALALAHLNKYIVVEDVSLTDISRDWARFSALGPATARAVESMGLGNNFDAMDALRHVPADFSGGLLHLVKNDLGPIRRAEFYVPIRQAEAFAGLLAERSEPLGMAPIDEALENVLRIEAGVPASFVDIDDQVIPPETRQVERGISYFKGCYLGQEVLERMRSRGSMARKLAAFRMAGEKTPERNAPIFVNGQEVGRITSACNSPALEAVLALGYVRMAVAVRGQLVDVATGVDATGSASVVDVPLPVHLASR
jgi:folate-binding protein YgfZ